MMLLYVLYVQSTVHNLGHEVARQLPIAHIQVYFRLCFVVPYLACGDPGAGSMSDQGKAPPFS
jgi:hypothetical protein